MDVVYSLKANASLGLCSFLAGCGLGADVASAGELVTALEAGFPPERIFVSGPDKSAAMLAQLTVTVNRIVVTDIQNGTYFAEIHLQNNGADVVVDSRPSDAIALALRMEAPIFVEEKVAAQAIPLKKAFDEHEVEEFRRFLDKVKPQDFRQ